MHITSVWPPTNKMDLFRGRVTLLGLTVVALEWSLGLSTTSQCRSPIGLQGDGGNIFENVPYNNVPNPSSTSNYKSSASPLGTRMMGGGDGEDVVMGYVTFPSLKEAKEVSNLLLKAGLVSCVNIQEKVTSMYSWKEEIHEDQEVAVTMKTVQRVVDSLTSFVIAHHSYDVPEVIFTPVVGGSSEYMNYVRKNIREPHLLVIPQEVNNNLPPGELPKTPSAKITIGVSEPLHLSMQGVPGTGYSWFYVKTSKTYPSSVPSEEPAKGYATKVLHKSDGIMVSDPKTQEPTQWGRDGGLENKLIGGPLTYYSNVFTKSPGTYYLTYVYKRPWNPKEAPTYVVVEVVAENEPEKEL